MSLTIFSTYSSGLQGGGDRWVRFILFEDLSYVAFCPNIIKNLVASLVQLILVVKIRNEIFVKTPKKGYC